MISRILLFASFIWIMNGHGQVENNSIQRIDYMKSIVSYLASDSLHGREVSSLYEKLAADFIFDKFKKDAKLRPKRHYFEYRTSDSARVWHSQNVYCYVNNHADSTIVIGAHFDHIGHGGGLSLAYSLRNQIHNGADDNASGVALMLCLASTHRELFNTDYNYLFVAYSAHEVGLYGSSAFYEYIHLKVKPISCMINFDMVGRLDLRNPQLSILVSTKKNKVISSYFEKLISNTRILMNYNAKIYNTDCRSFQAHGVESVSITTGIHSDYHKPSDDLDKLNFQGMNIIYEIVRDFIHDRPAK